MREYQASRDWSFFQNWLDCLPDSDSAHAFDSESEAHFVEVADWDARLDDMWDSISAVDHEEENRDNLELWEKIKSGAVEDDNMANEASQEPEAGISLTNGEYEQSFEHEDDQSSIEQNGERSRSDSLMEESSGLEDDGSLMGE